MATYISIEALKVMVGAESVIEQRKKKVFQKSQNIYKNKNLWLLKHERQTDGLSKSYTGGSMVQTKITQNSNHQS